MADLVKILIVENSDELRDKMVENIKDIESVQLFEASDGLSAIDIAKNNSLDIVIMSLLIPNIDGFEASKAIKEFNSDVIILAIVSIEDDETEKKLAEVGVNGYIRKPIQKNILHYKVINFINLVKSHKNIKRFHSHNESLNPFSKDIRSYKLFYFIHNKENLMDFGTYLLDYYHQNNQIAETFIFDAIVELLYNLLKKWTLHEKQVVITIEEGMDSLFLTLPLNQEYKLTQKEIELVSEIGDCIIIKDNIIHLKICRNMKKTSFKFKEAIQVRDIRHEEREILRKSYKDKTSAVEFLKTVNIDVMDEIQDLRDLEDELDVAIVDFELKNDKASLKEVADIFYKYGSLINSLYEFMALSYSLTSLSVTLTNAQDDIISNQSKKLGILLQGLRGDLIQWRKAIFVDKTSIDIHYLDSSLFSSCLQIESIFTQTEVEDSDEDDLELF